MSTAVLVDTSVFAYALGGEHAAREGCRRFLRDSRGQGLELHASVEMVQELTFHRMRMATTATAVEQGRLAGRTCILHPFDERVLDAALSLMADGSLRGRDAVHVATASLSGISTIVSTDPAFDGILERLDPAAG